MFGDKSCRILKGATLELDPALLADIRLIWKDLSSTSTLAYYKNLEIMSVKSFITLCPDWAKSLSFRATIEGPGKKMVTF